MVKYFSVDWLAQSHHSPTGTQDTDSARTHRPHVPCMVQPFAPVYGKGYLQPKSKASNPVQHAEQGEFGQHPHSSLCAPLRPVNCSSPISENSGYSSGYESEAASSECHSVEDRSGVDKDAPQRRVRTKFTPKQIFKLEKVFSKHKYLDAGERVKTAQKLNLSETQVRCSFTKMWSNSSSETRHSLCKALSVCCFCFTGSDLVSEQEDEAETGGSGPFCSPYAVVKLPDPPPGSVPLCRQAETPSGTRSGLPCAPTADPPAADDQRPRAPHPLPTFLLKHNVTFVTQTLKQERVQSRVGI
uniref:Ventral homeobox n=1 Tax=Oryzias latipes TaxID=8090 RepID=A0A3P9JAE6_ORYLA